MKQQKLTFGDLTNWDSTTLITPCFLNLLLTLTFKEFCAHYHGDQRFEALNRKKEQEVLFHHHYTFLKKRDQEKRSRIRKIIWETLKCLWTLQNHLEYFVELIQDLPNPPITFTRPSRTFCSSHWAFSYLLMDPGFKLMVVLVTPD